MKHRITNCPNCGTPFLTVVCRCGGELYIHESETVDVPPDVETATPCKVCGQALVFEPGFFRSVFADIRRSSGNV